MPRINIFSGTRRIAAIVAVGWSIILVVEFLHDAYRGAESYQIAARAKAKAAINTGIPEAGNAVVTEEGAALGIRFPPEPRDSPQALARLAENETFIRNFFQYLEIGKFLLLLFGGLLTLFTAMRILGWIVRGFLDIPMHLDHRPNDTKLN